jgi:hypothetical protein
MTIGFWPRESICNSNVHFGAGKTQELECSMDRSCRDFVDRALEFNEMGSTQWSSSGPVRGGRCIGISCNQDTWHYGRGAREINWISGKGCTWPYRLESQRLMASGASGKDTVVQIEGLQLDFADSDCKKMKVQLVSNREKIVCASGSRECTQKPGVFSYRPSRADCSLVGIPEGFLPQQIEEGCWVAYRLKKPRSENEPTTQSEFVETPQTSGIANLSCPVMGNGQPLQSSVVSAVLMSQKELESWVFGEESRTVGRMLDRGDLTKIEMALKETTDLSFRNQLIRHLDLDFLMIKPGLPIDGLFTALAGSLDQMGDGDDPKTRRSIRALLNSYLFYFRSRAENTTEQDVVKAEVIGRFEPWFQKMLSIPTEVRTQYEFLIKLSRDRFFSGVGKSILRNHAALLAQSPEVLELIESKVRTAQNKNESSARDTWSDSDMEWVGEVLKHKPQAKKLQSRRKR